jgi:FMN phosphatase YigB (HAD superfamily)
MLRQGLQKNASQSLNLDNIKAILFDLDGTLIDVDMYRFVPGYLRRLTAQMRELVNPAQATKSLHNAVAAMFANDDAGKTLQEVLLEVLSLELAMTPDQYTECLTKFCDSDLGELKPLVSGHASAIDLVEASLARGWEVVLATNPIFPRQVVDARAAWGGVDCSKFSYVTAYETEHFCKPNPGFFHEVMGRLNLEASDCLMVGNDPLHDLAAGQTGMQTCLLTPWSISRPGVEFVPDWKGHHSQLLGLIKAS